MTMILAIMSEIPPSLIGFMTIIYKHLLLLLCQNNLSTKGLIDYMLDD